MHAAYATNMVHTTSPAVHQWVDVFTRRVDYIHMNPVRAGIVEKEEEYLYGSCCDYHGT